MKNDWNEYTSTKLDRFFDTKIIGALGVLLLILLAALLYVHAI